MKINKELKNFYRFLWEYLEGGNSAIVIKPRQVGMTTFAARYAAWCLDYKYTGVKIWSPSYSITSQIMPMLDKFRCFNPYGYADAYKTHDMIMPDHDSSARLDIFDEVDYFDLNRLNSMADRFCGVSDFQCLGYSSVKNLEGITRLKSMIGPSIKDGKQLEVFDISNHLENQFRYEKKFNRNR